MKKLLCSILVGLAALSVTGCDDDEVKTPDFAVSTAQWTFFQQEGMQRMIADRHSRLDDRDARGGGRSP